MLLRPGIVEMRGQRPTTVARVVTSTFHPTHTLSGKEKSTYILTHELLLTPPPRPPSLTARPHFRESSSPYPGTHDRKVDVELLGHLGRRPHERLQVFRFHR